MLLSSCLKDSPVNVRSSSFSRRWPSRVRCQKHDFLLPSLYSWLQVLRKLLLKHRLCRMVFFQPSGAVWKKGKCSLGKDRKEYEGAQIPKTGCGATCCSNATLRLEISQTFWKTPFFAFQQVQKCMIGCYPVSQQNPRGIGTLICT